jgi:hypothetical protein
MMETLQMLYIFLHYYGAGLSFAFSIASILLVLDSRNFGRACSGILCHEVLKTDQSGSVMFKCCDCAGHGR